MNAETLAEAAAVLRRGGVVAFPTDTVYGLCADLFSVAAVTRIYEIKGRPQRMPLIAMLAEAAQWERVAASLPATAQAYIARWWPGPLTIIAPARAEVPAIVLGGGATIGMRVPDHGATLALLQQVEFPLATTSANRSGSPAACSAAEVAVQLDGLVDLILDAGVCQQGQASTVVDCTTDPPTIVREGPVTRADLGL
ncbi:MAG TPA: L-threonylcarbamoyladenylate synthase [Armatimonadota bacterium]